MQRRELLEKLISAATAAGLLGTWSMVSAHPHACERDATADVDALRWDLQRWARRDTSEQSAPMFLGLENLVETPGQQHFVAGQMNKELTAKFERLADLLLQYKPEPDESDVAALIVLMAEQELVPEAARFCT